MSPKKSKKQQKEETEDENDPKAKFRRKHHDIFVPNVGPREAKILLVGEGPGEQEEKEGAPFVGPAGELLMRVLNNNGIQREEVRLSNLCHYRPVFNKFEYVLKCDVLRDGLTELYGAIREVKPNVIVPLGSWPLYFLTGRKGITKWRGSIIPFKGDPTIKCIPTFHPSAVLREPTYYPTFVLDIRRIVADSATANFALPERRFIIEPTGLDCTEWTERLCASDYLACDIETVKSSTHILCVGFSPSKDIAIVFNTQREENRAAIQRILESRARKIFQFGTFDITQLRLNGYQVQGVDSTGPNESSKEYFWDTLLAQHVLAPELPRSLEYLTSVYTREPYYKDVGRGSIPDDSKGWGVKFDRMKLYEYNGKDCCVTYEVFEKQREELTNENDRRIFDFEMELLEVYHHISDSGMLIDEERRATLEKILLTKWGKKQFLLNKLLGCDVNVKSPKLKNILYDKDKLGLPPRRDPKTGNISANEDAIVSLIAYCKGELNSVSRDDAKLRWRIRLSVCETILEIRGIRQVLSNYILTKLKSGPARIGLDGRIRSTYKVGGTETGRGSANKYVDGSGNNGQTWPRDPVEYTAEDLGMAAEEAVLMLARELADDPDVDDDSETVDEETEELVETV